VSSSPAAIRPESGPPFAPARSALTRSKRRWRRPPSASSVTKRCLPSTAPRRSSRRSRPASPSSFADNSSAARDYQHPLSSPPRSYMFLKHTQRGCSQEPAQTGESSYIPTSQSSFSRERPSGVSGGATTPSRLRPIARRKPRRPPARRASRAGRAGDSQHRIQEGASRI
jgi:hypothetical protein